MTARRVTARAATGETLTGRAKNGLAGQRQGTRPPNGQRPRGAPSHAGLTHRHLSHYDRAYFDKWYRNPRHRVKTTLDMTRQLRFVVAATEYLLDRPIRRVLDVGCGEGNWRAVLKRLRPGVRYYGVDGSAYAVRRFGRRRGIRLGTFGTLDALGLPDEFDLVLCIGVLNYVGTAELRAGLRHLRRMTAGAAYLEIFTRADDATGDFSREYARWPGWYRQEIRQAGFAALGMHLYVPRNLAWHAAALERADWGR